MCASLAKGAPVQNWLRDFIRTGKFNQNRRLLRAAVYATSGTPPSVKAIAYLTGDTKIPLTSKSGWARIHTFAPDAANGFVVTLARDLRQHGCIDLARPAIEKLWESDVRTPIQLGDIHSDLNAGRATSRHT
jgi:hypothetical protein